MQTIKAIETRYRGFNFRSRLEARTAVAFDEMGVEFVYEPEGYDLDGCGKYLPDFWLPNPGCFVEVKPKPLWHPQWIYLAGTCKTRWRSGLNLHGNFAVNPAGSAPDKHDDFASVLFERSVEGLQDADAVVAWIDRADCYATFVEIGMAHSMPKRIYVGFDAAYLQVAELSGVYWDYSKPCHDHWFAQLCGDEQVVCESPQDMIDGLLAAKRLQAMPDEYHKAQCLANATKKDVWILFDCGLDEISERNVSSVQAVLCKPGRIIDTRAWPGLIFGNQATSRGWQSTKLLTQGLRAARSARFEHGQSGAT